MGLLRLVLAAGALALMAAILWASFTGAILAEGAAMLALPWGVVTFLDLYLGFILAATAMLVLEPVRPLGIVLALLVFVLGNVLTAAWLAWRAPLIWRRLRG